MTSSPAANETPVDGLRCLHTRPSSGDLTFVFVNALTGSTDQWEAVIAPALRDQGYGTLSYNFRGQVETEYGAEDALDDAQIVRDLHRVVSERVTGRCVLVGLSIGGLFAARAMKAGLACEGIVLINTLRKPGLALDWTNEAVFRASKLGGSQLVMDLFLPMLLGPEKLSEMRAACLGDSAYTPLDATSGIYRLIKRSRDVDWEFAWSNIECPVLVVTGLRDRVFLDRNAVEEIKAEIADVEEIVLADAGHLIPIEQPEILAGALQSFAERLSSQPHPAVETDAS
ncbi:MAG: alpha/beta hydrolase [Pseudomonadota bacterium]